MATKTTSAPDTDALVEHFRALPFAEKKTVLDACQAVLAEEAETERKDLLSRLAELDRMTGRPEASAPQKAGDAEGRTRGKAPPKYRSKKEPQQVWSGRGADPIWLKEEMAETGEPKESFLIAA